MKKQLVWNVYYYNTNKQKIQTWNIFQHGSFYEHLLKAKKEFLKTDDFRFNDFMERVKKDLQYYYWSKCEWEIVVHSWPAETVSEKIDVYDQVINNWEAFREYLFNNYKLIKKVK